MDIGEKGIGGPSSHNFDGVRWNVVEVHSHGAAGAKGVGAYCRGGDAIEGKSEGCRGFSDRYYEHIMGCDGTAEGVWEREISADDFFVVGSVVSDMLNSANQGFDGTVWQVGYGVVDDLVAASVLLVGDAQGGFCAFGQEDCEGKSVWELLMIFPKDDIFDAEGACPGLFLG